MTNERGLGTLIKKATSSVGIKPCGGCEERARRLNQYSNALKRAVQNVISRRQNG